MTLPKPGKKQVAFNLYLEDIDKIESIATEKSLTKSDAVAMMISEWIENRVKEPPDPVLVPVVDRSTIKRVDELQRAVEALTQKVSNLTLRERLGRYSGG